MPGKSDDQYGAEETRQRLVKTLRGAFTGPPTPLKNIPKQDGESRVAAKKRRASAASAKNVRPGT